MPFFWWETWYWGGTLRFLWFLAANWIWNVSSLQASQRCFENFNLWLLMRGCTTNCTLQGTNISHLGNRKIIFNMPFLGDMLVPWRVVTAPKSGCSQLFWQIYDILISELFLISWLLCTGCSNSLFVVYLPRLDHGSTWRKYTIHLVLVLFLVCFDFWQFPLIEDMSRVDRCFSWAVYSNLSRARALAAAWTNWPPGPTRVVLNSKKHPTKTTLGERICYGCYGCYYCWWFRIRLTSWDKLPTSTGERRISSINSREEVNI